VRLLSENVLIALITGLCAVIGQWLISRSQNEKRKTEEAVRDARLEDRLRSVEKKLDVHNGYAEKFSEIQTDIAVIRNDIKTLYKERN
jgi:lipopolysaccharide export LptBFGC system permease protein LptF